MTTIAKRLALILACLVLAGNSSCPFDIDEILEEADGETSGLTYARAVHVIGQTSLTTAETRRSADADTLSVPGGVVFFGDRLYIADTNDNRVTAYDGFPSANNPTADFVLGQDSVNDDARGRGAGGMSSPDDLLADLDGMAVSDSANHRVLLWNTRPASQADADRVFGQPALDDDLGSGCAGDRVDDPWGVAVAGERLLVADHGNHRVLYWERDAASGAFATGVLGQVGFLSCQENRGANPAADTLASPAGLWSNGTRLAVADRDNNRVLLWDSFPDNGEPADVVLGQANMDENTIDSGGPERGMHEPSDVFWSHGRLFVADWKNHRVLVYSGWPTRNHARPDAVLGQPDLETTEANNTGDTNSVNGRSLSLPKAVWADGDHVLVSDSDNDRVLVFELP